MELKGRVLVYSILGCPHCMRSKNTLQELGIPYTDVRLDIYPKEVRQALKERTAKATVPQIFFNAHFIGGADDFEKMLKFDKMRLDKLVGELAVNPPPDDAPVPPDSSTALKSCEAAEFECVQDEYYELVLEIKKSMLIKDHRKGLRVMKKSFTGKEFVNWVVLETELDRNDAVEMGQNLLDTHFGVQVNSIQGEGKFNDDDTLYRLLEDSELSALNGGAITRCEPRSAVECALDLRKMILKMHAAFLSKDGKVVDYKGMKNSIEFEHYRRMAQELQRVSVVGLSRKQKLAFFINIYNAMVMHGHIDRCPPTTLWQRYKFFNTVKYLIGGCEYSLQDLENGVLRGNSKGMGMLTKPFKSSDPRMAVALDKTEPLIHFALVCGARSCPPIKTYTSEAVMEQLKVAAEAFLDDDESCTVDMDSKVVRLSMIFKWYRKDFGSSDQQVLEWVYAHMPEADKKNYLRQLLAVKKFKVKYFKYDWTSNSKI